MSSDSALCRRSWIVVSSTSVRRVTSIHPDRAGKMVFVQGAAGARERVRARRRTDDLRPYVLVQCRGHRHRSHLVCLCRTEYRLACPLRPRRRAVCPDAKPCGTRRHRPAAPPWPAGRVNRCDSRLVAARGSHTLRVTFTLNRRSRIVCRTPAGASRAARRRVAVAGLRVVGRTSPATSGAEIPGIGKAPIRTCQVGTVVSYLRTAG